MLHRDQVLALARARGATNVRVFGSAAKGADRADSDIDLLVTWSAERSLLDLISLQLELQDAVGVRIDLATESELDPLLRDLILEQAMPL
jgi:predicted nucleotidyltransferase